MPRTLKPVPKNIVEVRQSELIPYISDSKGSDNSALADIVRGNEISVKDNEIKEFNVGLEDIDNSIIYYFDNVIKPQVKQNNLIVKAPLIYGSPERWQSIQKEGYLRDKDGKLMVPLIIFKRSSLEKNRSIGNKLDGNIAQLNELTEVRYNKKNIYDKFSIMNNRVPSKQYMVTVIPDYVKLTYECIIFTDYIEQNNKIIEAINYASDSYWGDLKRFNFRTKIDSFTNSVSLEVGEDRIVKTTFNIIMNGYIIPDSINKELSTKKSQYSPSQVVINIEESDSTPILKTSADIMNRIGNIIFIDNQNANPQYRMIQNDIVYLSINKIYDANSVTNNTATFNNTSILNTPVGSSLPPTSLASFTFYINGQYIDYQNIISFIQSGNNTILTVDNTKLGYILESSDIITVIGKFN